MDYNVISVLKILMDQTHVSLIVLKNQLELSPRQMEYRLEKLNEILLQRYQFQLIPTEDGELVLDNQQHAQLTHLYEELMQESEYFLNTWERKAYIYLFIFANTSSKSIVDFTENLSISKSTFLNDLKELRTELAQQDITIKNHKIHGYYLQGKELTLRRKMIELVNMLFEKSQNMIVLNKVLKDIGEMAVSTLQEPLKVQASDFNVSFVGDRLALFSYVFIFVKNRIAQENWLVNDYSHFETICHLREYQFIQNLCQAQAIHFQENVEETELSYLSALIISISVGNAEDPTSDREIIADLVKRIMERFEVLSGTTYLEYQEIFSRVYAHFRPAYYRLLFKIPVINPLGNKIKTEYSQLFSLVKETMAPLEALFESKIPDSEIAYLTLHFASIYSDTTNLPKQRKKGVIVCTNGIGSSAILYNELVALFPNISFYHPMDAKTFESFDQPYDMIFTNQFEDIVMNASQRVYRVSPVMNSMEKYELQRNVYRNMPEESMANLNVGELIKIITKYADITDEVGLRQALMESSSLLMAPRQQMGEIYHLKDLLSEASILLNQEVDNWKEAIQLAGNLLVANGKVLESYVSRMIALPSASQYVITPGIALPHIKAENDIMQYGMSIVTLKTPVDFGNQGQEPVNIIFCLSAKQENKHLEAMGELVAILQNPGLLEKLTQAEQSYQVMKYIEEMK